ncbi:hypothetical protein [Bacillus velezensis]|uniref:hypothetical protein n=1 Tax=Bacillus velezensis TaxID=492670 RepID=UPI0039FC1801
MVLALEKDQDAVTTYRYNHGDHVVQCDIKLLIIHYSKIQSTCNDRRCTVPGIFT